MKKFFVPNSFVEIIICGISGLPSEIKDKNEWGDIVISTDVK